MRTFLGVPILLRGVAYGNLYLTEKQDGEDFTVEDEELVTLLAGQAAVAIENARLYEASNRWSRQLQSLNEVGNALATETDLDRLLDLIVRRLRELLDARVVALALPIGSDELRFAAVAGAEGLLGTTHLPIRVEERRACSSAGGASASTRCSTIPRCTRRCRGSSRARTGMWVPLIGRGDAIGVLEIHDKQGPDPRFTHDDFRLAETFATRAAVAVELSQRVARDAVRRVVAGAGARAPEARARAPRRDRAGADLDPARAEAARGGARGPPGARRSRAAARARRQRTPGRAPPGRRAASGRARRLRPRSGARAADRARSPSSRRFGSTSTRRSARCGCRPRSSRRSTGSCRSR